MGESGRGSVLPGKPRCAGRVLPGRLQGLEMASRADVVASRRDAPQRGHALRASGRGRRPRGHGGYNGRTGPPAGSGTRSVAPRRARRRDAHPHGWHRPSTARTVLHASSCAVTRGASSEGSAAYRGNAVDGGSRHPPAFSERGRDRSTGPADRADRRTRDRTPSSRGPCGPVSRSEPAVQPLLSRALAEASFHRDDKCR